MRTSPREGCIARLPAALTPLTHANALLEIVMIITPSIYCMSSVCLCELYTDCVATLNKLSCAKLFAVSSYPLASIRYTATETAEKPDLDVTAHPNYTQTQTTTNGSYNW